MIKAGSLRHRVNIQTRTNTQDPDTGEFIETWATSYSDVPCAIEALSAREFIQSKADQTEYKVRVTLRHRTGLDSTIRLVGTCGCHSGKIYSPHGVLEDKHSARHYLTLPCSEGVSEG